MTRAEWIAIAEAELVRHGYDPVTVDIEAMEIWEVLSDYGRDTANALRWDPAAAAREVIAAARRASPANDA